MAAVKTFALAVLVSTVLTQASRADAIMQWTTWQPGSNGPTNSMPSIAASLESLFWPTAAAAVPAQPAMPPAPIAPAPQVQPAPTPVVPVYQASLTPAASDQPAIVSAPPAAPVPAPTPVVTAAPFTAPVSPSQPADAFVNLGNGPYPNSGQLTTGNAQAWYNSSQIVGLFGGHPTAQQQAAFDSAVVQRVEQTFQLSGVPVTLTTDPNAPAAHTLSVVSNTANGSIPNAIGMTYLGGNGFNFIDQAAHAAQSVDQLEWIVAHNVSHELMLAFGVGENFDKSGNYIDARNANLSMMLDPNASFSPAASQALLQNDFTANNSMVTGSYAQVLPAPVPEPATVVLWSLGAAALLYARRTKMRRSAK